jgi:hypothetical protein
MRIVSASSNDDFSAQNRPRDLKMVSLEPSGNKDSEYDSENCSSLPVNETETQNVWQHHFPEPCGGGGRCGTNWPTEAVEMATLCEFDENDRFFTAFCDPYKTHTFSSHFQTFFHI